MRGSYKLPLEFPVVFPSFLLSYHDNPVGNIAYTLANDHAQYLTKIFLIGGRILWSGIARNIFGYFFPPIKGAKYFSICF